MDEQTVDKTSRKTLKSRGVFLLSVLLALLLFVSGNMAAHIGLFDIGELLGVANPRAVGFTDGTAAAPAIQVGARVEEVGALLDSEALYGYTQDQLDEVSATAIRALLDASEDSHAVYYTADEYDAYLRESQGEYAGIGVVLTMFEQRATVLQVYADSPAAQAGVLPGDVVLAIDGLRQDWSPASASEAIHRPVAETVEVIWERKGQEISTTITLGAVSVPTVVSHLIEDQGATVGYLYLRRFNTNSAAEVQDALLELEAFGAQSYILDLRNNPGGYVDQAVELTSLFVAEGEVVRVEERSRTDVYQVTGDPVTDKPLAVIVNANSASASELTAAALQDYQRATIVGETTYGKGTVQNVRFLSFGGALRYTIAHYLSPAGRSVEGSGLTPDVVVAERAGDQTSSDGSVQSSYHPTLEELLADNLTSADYHYRIGVDPQLDAALAAVIS